MPRRRRSVAPQDQISVLLERIETLESRLSVMGQAKMSSVQVVDIENFNDPIEGMAAIDWPTGRYCFYHDGAWICVPSLPVHAIKVYSDRSLNKVGDGAFKFAIEEDLAGTEIVAVAAFNGTVGTTGTTVQISKSTGTARGTDLLTTPITIDANEYTSYTSIIPVIAHNVMNLGDMIWINVDAVGSGSKGLGVYITFAPPSQDNTV